MMEDGDYEDAATTYGIAGSLLVGWTGPIDEDHPDQANRQKLLAECDTLAVGALRRNAQSGDVCTQAI